jgi:hypothetical protein
LRPAILKLTKSPPAARPGECVTWTVFLAGGKISLGTAELLSYARFCRVARTELGMCFGHLAPSQWDRLLDEALRALREGGGA